MESITLLIKGMKCYREESFAINNLTILTGANASGKSTVIQSLLMLYSGYTKHTKSNFVTIPLQDDSFAFDIQDADDLMRLDSTTLHLQLGTFSCECPVERENELASIRFDVSGDGDIFSDGLFFLSAERLGPRSESKIARGTDDGCGSHGQYTATIIVENEGKLIESSKFLHPTDDRGKLGIAKDQWLSYIFPGIIISTPKAGTNSYQVNIYNGSMNKTSTAPNVGFGISYSLPIIINGLLIPRNGWLIVENPEAHLHAKAQSNMGFFLGCMAASGVRVILETHSEHIVNGIRRSILSKSNTLKNDDVSIYFLNAVKDKGIIKKEIKIDSFGNLSDMPVDFFDQSRQDMLEMFNMIQSEM